MFDAFMSYYPDSWAKTALGNMLVSWEILKIQKETPAPTQTLSPDVLTVDITSVTSDVWGFLL